VSLHTLYRVGGEFSIGEERAKSIFRRKKSGVQMAEGRSGANAQLEAAHVLLASLNFGPPFDATKE